MFTEFLSSYMYEFATITNSIFNDCIASQMWLLGRLLHILVGQYVPEDDEHWCNYLLLLNIVDIMFAKNHGGHPRLPAPAD